MKKLIYILFLFSATIFGQTTTTTVGSLKLNNTPATATGNTYQLVRNPITKQVEQQLITGGGGGGIDHAKGNYNASTNIPALSNGTGILGDYYTVTVAGSRFGFDFKINDRIEYNGLVWVIVIDNNAGLATVLNNGSYAEYNNGDDFYNLGVKETQIRHIYPNNSYNTLDMNMDFIELSSGYYDLPNNKRFLNTLDMRNDRFNLYNKVYNLSDAPLSESSILLTEQGVGINTQIGLGNSLFFKNDNLTGDRTRQLVDANGNEVLSVKGNLATINGDINLDDKYVPLSGTTAGNPIVGRIELSRGDGGLYSDDANYTNNFDADAAGWSLQGLNKLNGFTDSFATSDLSFSVISNNPSFRGLEGGSNYSENYNPFSYTQKIYVDALFASATGTTNITYTPSIRQINSSSGTGAVLPIANGTNYGLSINDYTTLEKNKLASTPTTFFNGQYSSLAGIPSTFTPSAHDHIISNVTGLQASLDLKANLVNPTFTGTVSGITATMVGAPSGSGNTTGTNTGDNATNSQYSGLLSNATHTGDATGATVLTLATVNSNVGSFTNANVTVDAKGRITAVSNGVGSVSETDPTVKAINGIVKSNGTTISSAVAGTDYALPNANTTGTSANITAITNSTITTLSNLSLPASQVTGLVSGGNVNNIGTPTAGQVAEFTNATTIQGVGTTGSGSYAKSVSPTFTTPNLGTPSTLVGTNISGTANSLTAGNINATTNNTITSLPFLGLLTSQLIGGISNAQLNGNIDLTTKVTGILPVANGGLLSGGTALQIYRKNATNTGYEWATVSLGGGEINTASNTGTVGTGLFKQKNVFDLEFYKLNAASNKVTVELNGTDRVDVDVVPANFTNIPQAAVTNLTTDLAARSIIANGLQQFTGTTLSQFTESATPTLPTTGIAKVYVKEIGGRATFSTIDDFGEINHLQSSLSFNKLSAILPGATNTPTVIGRTMTNLTTVSHPAPATTNFKSSTNRITFTSAATAGSVTGSRVAVNECLRGNANKIGGFYIVNRISLTTLQAGQRGFFGLSTLASTAPTNIDPLTSTTAGVIGIGFNSNTGNWQLITNTAGVAPTVLDLGANFPINITDVVELVIYTPANKANVFYRVKNLNTDLETIGTLSTNLPLNTSAMGRTGWMTNNATAASVAFDILVMSCETQY
jgi:hypothetical protein